MSMSERERATPEPVPSPERPKEAPSGQGELWRAARIEASHARTETEAAEERRQAKEKVAETVWAHPAQFVGRVIERKLGPFLKRFLAKFGGLDDEALRTEALRKAREDARKEAEK